MKSVAATVAGIDPRAFRTACGKFATGVTVVTVREGLAARGMTANSFCSISLDPPLVSVSIDRGNRTHDLLGVGDRFAVNVLGRHQVDMSARYAGCQRGAHTKFDDVPHQVSGHGLPLLDGAVAHFECQVASVLGVGDHSIFIGTVEQLQFNDKVEPLVFYSGSYRDMALASLAPEGEPPSFVDC